MPTFCSLRGTAKLYLLFLVGFLPFVPVRERMLCAVLLHEHEARLLAQRLVWVGWLAAVCSPERLLGLLTGLMEHPAFVLHLQRRGMAVSFWTANTEVRCACVCYMMLILLDRSTLSAYAALALGPSSLTIPRKLCIDFSCDCDCLGAQESIRLSV